MPASLHQVSLTLALDGSGVTLTRGGVLAFAKALQPLASA
jgi:hypothetical protein